MPTHCSTCSPVTTPPPTKLGVQSGQEGPRQAATLARGQLATSVGGSNGHAPSADVFQSSGSAALPAGDHDVDGPGVKFPQSLIL
jgi:hypothetical protein